MRRIVLFSLALAIAALCSALGVWQLRRLAARRAANREISAARALPPLGPDLPGRTPLLPNRRAILPGELDERREFILRDRVIRGVPAVMIITPLRLPGTDTAVLVNRGYVPAPDAVDPGAATWSEPGPRVFRGLLLPIPDHGDGAPHLHNGRETWRRLDLTAMRARLPYPLAPLYLVAEADSSEGVAHTMRGTAYPFRAEPIPLDDGPHLMYAVQWFGIAAAVVAFGVIFVLRGGTGRRVNGQQSTVNGTGLARQDDETRGSSR
jgi:surfeit locus 1 family protein